MPRKTSQSQEPSTSRGTRRKQTRPRSSSDESEEENKSRRSTLLQPVPIDTATLANNMVKYILNFSATKIPIKRTDISKSLNIAPKLFPEVFDACTSKLRHIYGLEVTEIHDKSLKMFIVHSTFDSTVTALQFSKEQRNEVTLLFIVLSYIFMKGGEVQEGKTCATAGASDSHDLFPFSSSPSVPGEAQH